MSETPKQYESLHHRHKTSQQELQELNSDIKFSLSVAIGSVALAGASAYATYETITGKNTDLAPLAVGGGASLLGAAVAIQSIPQTVSLIKKRNALANK